MHALWMPTIFNQTLVKQEKESHSYPTINEAIALSPVTSKDVGTIEHPNSEATEN